MVLSLILSASVAGCQGSDAPDDELTPARRVDVPRVAPAEEALSGVHVPTVDPAWLNGAEIEAVLGSEPYCVFRYASNGRPVLALRLNAAQSPSGVVKLNGFLVPLTDGPGEKGVREVTAGAVHATLVKPASGIPDANENGPARLTFQVDGKMRADFAGYSDCPA